MRPGPCRMLPKCTYLYGDLIDLSGCVQYIWSKWEQYPLRMKVIQLSLFSLEGHFFLASSIHYFLSKSLTNFIRNNRRHIGLSFALALTIHLVALTSFL